MDLTLIILAIIGSGSFATIVTSFVYRRRDRANTAQTTAKTNQIQIESRRSEVLYYQETVDKLVSQMRDMEQVQTDMRVAQEAAQERYEQRVGGLREKIEGLAVSLKQANNSLDIANKTIAALRDKVEDGNAKITELREEITQLLVARAVQEGTGGNTKNTT